MAGQDTISKMPHASASPLSVSRRLLFSLLPLIIVLLTVEMLARGVCWVRFSAYGTSIAIQGDARWSPHPKLVWTNRPLYLEYNTSAQYNRYGLRVSPGDIEMPPKGRDEVWVFCLGGSTMAGVGSAQTGDWLKITGIPTHDIAHSIDGYLQTMLREALPDTKVRVFNAAVAGHSLRQSLWTYERLRELKPDWVVSLDGVNDPTQLSQEDTLETWLTSKWTGMAVNRWPFQSARLLMRNSGLMFLFGEYLFFQTGIIRTPSNTRQDWAVLEYWLQKKPVRDADIAGEEERNIQRAVSQFLRSLGQFHDRLLHDQQKHVLLVQPYLRLRNVQRLTDVEQALFNYYTRVPWPSLDRFMREIHTRVSVEFADTWQVVSTAAMHEWKDWVFLDYCHLTSQANRRIAWELAQTITSQGQYRPFGGEQSYSSD